MKPKTVVRLVVDAAMTLLLLLLMAFELVGRAAHEWIGIGMFFAFLFHHLLNRGWAKRLFQGKYTPYRVLQTVTAALVFLAMRGSFASAVFISQEVFAFLPIRQGMALGRIVHLLCAYWGYLFVSLHLGLHWGMMVAMAGKKLSPCPRRRVVLNILGVAVALYGVFALFQRQIPTYLFLQSQFVFFDFDEPLAFFLVDYLAVMAAFVWLGTGWRKIFAVRDKAGRENKTTLPLKFEPAERLSLPQ